MLWRPAVVLLSMPVLALLVALAGCEGPTPGKKRPRSEGDSAFVALSVC